ncbi:hypothetical protein ACP70R_046752 [Stipagrostis hirtigluma subsp. patula]
MEAYAGSVKAEKEHARLMLKNLKLDYDKPHAGSSKEKTKESQFSIGPEKKGGESKAGAAKRRKKVTVRLGKEYLEIMTENPPPPLYQPHPSLDPQFMEMQERFVARQKAELDMIRQCKEVGYIDLEIEVTDDEGDNV